MAVNRLESRWSRAALLLVAVGLMGACSKKIGDDCQTSIDCSINNDRLCDISEPGGYCTVEGCDETSCPDDSVCVRFFPSMFLINKCTDGGGCAPDEICLTGDGLCAPRILERRFCERSCSSNGDCRGGYTCQTTGMNGTLALTGNAGAQARYCAPPNP